jgi:hypothetical protein
MKKLREKYHFADKSTENADKLVKSADKSAESADKLL